MDHPSAPNSESGSAAPPRSTGDRERPALLIWAGGLLLLALLLFAAFALGVYFGERGLTRPTLPPWPEPPPTAAPSPTLPRVACSVVRDPWSVGLVLNGADDERGE